MSDVLTTIPNRWSMYRQTIKISPHNIICYIYCDRLFGVVVETSDCHPRGPGFDSRLYLRKFSGSIGSGTDSTQPREDNLVAI